MKKKHLYVLGMISGLGVASSEVYLSTLPFLLIIYGVSEYLLNLTITTYFLSTALSCFLFPLINLKISHRNLFLSSIGIFSLATCLISIKLSEEILLIGRSLQGLSFGIIQPLLIAHIRFCFKGQGIARDMSSITCASEALAATVPILGALLFTYGNWNLPFLFIFFLSLGLLFYSFKFSFQNQILSAKNSFKENMIFVLKNKNFNFYNTISILIIGLNWSFATVLSYELNNPILHGTILSICGLIYASGGFCFERGYISERKVLTYFRKAVSLFGIMFFFSFITKFILGLFISLILFAFVSGVFYGVSVEKSLLDIDSQKTNHASSIFTCSRLLSSAVFIQLSSFLYFHQRIYYIISITLIIGMLVYLFGRKESMALKWI